MKHTFTIRQILFLLILGVLYACGGKSAKQQANPDLNKLSWSQIEAQAKGQTVNLMMWMGDPLINAYMKKFVQAQLKEKYDIRLNIISGQGKEILSTLIAEKEAGKTNSEIDMMWINGETFFQLKQIKALYGPFTAQLPNARLINFNSRFINTDFQQPVDGMECPWGNVQLALIYNSNQVKNPPKNLKELEQFVKAHPGKFTLGTEFTGITLLKSMLIALANDPKDLYGKFDQAKYDQYSAKLWQYLRRLKPYLWKAGKTFPSTLAAMHQMFANGELWFTMSNNDCEVDNKIAQGTFPAWARAYVLESGTIQNSHYLGITQTSPNKAAAMVAINYMISPEAQYEKFKPATWGDGTVLAMEKLPKNWQDKFAQLPTRKYAPKRADIQQYALVELAPEYMIKLHEDFRKEIIRQ
ncbi:ABC transporter substrate-binding protein [Microscilla marina]|uniref:Protein YnjB n=1 Tax=Microscilla marina ATCC 23134 TaxID=313606 RepID=A1ZSX7_MICM2|nr:ABC transporter substrate-binding protein [Microscilla marina]EAY26541.1 protein YnjB [Microscilla marina ATCC 23134]